MRELLRPRATGAVALVVGLCLFLCDCMFNAMINAVYIVVLGGVTSLAAGTAARRPALPIRALPQRRRSKRVVHCLS